MGIIYLFTQWKIHYSRLCLPVVVKRFQAADFPPAVGAVMYAYPTPGFWLSSLKEMITIVMFWSIEMVLSSLTAAKPADNT